MIYRILVVLDGSVHAQHALNYAITIAEAFDAHVDLIVMGSRGLGGVTQLFLGSVSDRVADEAPCPVLIVKE